jgi:hypothetical protein
MELVHKLFFRRFSAEEYKQLKEIHIEETKQLRKRVQFIVGLILLSGLMFYFFFRAFGIAINMVLLLACIGGIIAGVFTVWLLSRWFKLNKVFVIFIIVQCIILPIVTSSRGSREFEWEYLVYTMIILVGFISLNDSIREYFCERLLREQQKQGLR